MKRVGKVEIPQEAFLAGVEDGNGKRRLTSRFQNDLAATEDTGDAEAKSVCTRSEPPVLRVRRGGEVRWWFRKAM